MPSTASSSAQVANLTGATRNSSPASRIATGQCQRIGTSARRRHCAAAAVPLLRLALDADAVLMIDSTPTPPWILPCDARCGAAAGHGVSTNNRQPLQRPTAATTHAATSASEVSGRASEAAHCEPTHSIADAVSCAQRRGPRSVGGSPNLKPLTTSFSWATASLVVLVWAAGATCGSAQLSLCPSGWTYYYDSSGIEGHDSCLWLSSTTALWAQANTACR